MREIPPFLWSKGELNHTQHQLDPLYTNGETGFNRTTVMVRTQTGFLESAPDKSNRHHGKRKGQRPSHSRHNLSTHRHSPKE